MKIIKKNNDEKNIKEGFSKSTKLTTTVIILSVSFVLLIILVIFLNVKNRGGFFNSMIKPVFSFKPLNLLPAGVRGEAQAFMNNAQKYGHQFDKYSQQYNNMAPMAQNYIKQTMNNVRYHPELRQHINNHIPNMRNISMYGNMMNRPPMNRPPMNRPPINRPQYNQPLYRQ